MKYDFIIVGAGITGATCARLLTDKGYKCVIIEERPFVGGNSVSDKQFNIEVHLFGPHIFHTNNKDVWDFVNTYTDFIPSNFNVMVSNENELFSLSFDQKMLYDIYGKYFPRELQKVYNDDKLTLDNRSPENLEEFISVKYSKTIYEKLFKNFYGKLYNIEPFRIIPQMSQISQEMTFFNNNGFYKDKYQGIPDEGYKTLIEKIIGDDIPIVLNTNFLANKDKYVALANHVIYTGEIDKFFNYCIGKLGWLSTGFVIRDEIEHTNNLLGCPIMNFADKNTKWFRITEHKWFDPEKHKDNIHTIVTYEYPREWKIGDEAFYPFYTNQSLNLYSRYVEKLKEQYPNVILCGRRAEYTMYSMGECIESAMNLCSNFDFRS